MFPEIALYDLSIGQGKLLITEHLLILSPFCCLSVSYDFNLFVYDKNLSCSEE